MNKLSSGDTVRVVAPSRSHSIISEETRTIAKKHFATLGLQLTFGKHIEETDEFLSSSIESRIEDLHEAYKDPRVKAIFTVIGGFNCNQLLSHLDYDLIRENPKILIGYSDTTALLNAIHKKTGQITYLGPAYSTLGMKHGLEYTLEELKKALFNDTPYELKPSKEWSEDEWYKEQEDRTFKPNPGHITLQAGTAEGTVIGGNLCTFQLLNGTTYMPEHQDTILVVEDCVEDPETFVVNFDRDLQSLIHQPWFSSVRGILIGRFETTSRMTLPILQKIIATKQELRGIPIIANIDCGHNTPHTTIPIGGVIEITATEQTSRILVKKH